MANWRPENWENPYANFGADLDKVGRALAFEAGADEMYEAMADSRDAKIVNLVSELDRWLTQGQVLINKVEELDD